MNAERLEKIIQPVIFPVQGLSVQHVLNAAQPAPQGSFKGDFQRFPAIVDRQQQIPPVRVPP